MKSHQIQQLSVVF